MSLLKILGFTSTVGLFLLISSISLTYGHGLGYEVLPPVKLGDKEVALEVTSAQYSDPESTDRQITLSLFDVNTAITIRDVTYHILAKKGNEFLFEETFQSDNGIFTMNFIPTDSGEILVEKDKQGGLFDSILGLEKDIVNIRGSPFGSGGLYNLDVKILTAESYSELEKPIEYEVGLSIPDRTYYEIDDPNFGVQEISLITYYDQIEDFQYDSTSQSLSFKMPFDWSFENINQTSVVHEELVVPKTFGDLMVSSFSVLVNDLEVPDYALTIDDFSEKTRIIHVVLNQNDLFSLSSKHDSQDKMGFLIKPAENGLPLATVTGNGQFRISLFWEPYDIKSGSQTTFYFDITDVFLKDRPVSVSYDLSLINDGKVIDKQSGVSTDSKDEKNIAEFMIPMDVSGPITLQFENLDGNGLARVGIPVVVNRINFQPSENNLEELSIPDWVRNNAGWWSKQQIDDNDFASGIEFLIKEKIVVVPASDSVQPTEDAIIPDWVRNNAGWWSDGLISDQDFASGLQFLIKNGIISV